MDWSIHFDIFSYNSSLNLYKGFNVDFQLLFLEKTYLGNFLALIPPFPILTPKVSPPAR